MKQNKLVFDKIESFCKYLQKDINNISMVLTLWRLAALIIFFSITLQAFFIIITQRFTLISFGVVLFSLITVLYTAREIDYFTKLKNKDQELYLRFICSK